MPDLVILDVIMPGLGGRAVYDALPKQGAGLRFLFASGYSTNLIQTGLVSDQRFDVIQKPFSPQELLRKVRRALDEPPPASL